MVAFPEELQKVFIGDLRRIEIDPQSLGMAAEIMVRGMFFLATRIAHASANDAVETPEPGIWSPESPKGEDGALQYFRAACINGWSGRRRLLISSVENGGHGGHRGSFHL